MTETEEPASSRDDRERRSIRRWEFPIALVLSLAWIVAWDRLGIDEHLPEGPAGGILGSLRVVPLLVTTGLWLLTSRRAVAGGGEAAHPTPEPSEQSPAPDDAADETSPRLIAGIKFAIQQVPASNDLSGLSHEVRTVLLVHAAQGLIDNGGLQYFFESDFTGQPPYTVFTDAYREIGAHEAAAVLERAVALFPFDNPHLSAERRNEVMDSFKDEDDEPVDSPFQDLTGWICGDQEVWIRLEAYMVKHGPSFGLA